MLQVRNNYMENNYIFNNIFMGLRRKKMIYFVSNPKQLLNKYYQRQAYDPFL